ncbi:MAG: LpxL/LpxP family Kdo(2)-lipid IV(A) lauroyl/palmitoleoyl acyltransferase [bacterium]|nr:LpxL/LpxP family Kdo(2)-lipid IV(A) lauroyl/palmitoleoyl acyltransferase [bacterium]
MATPASEPSLLAPRHWPAWTGIALIWLLAQLPWWLQRRLGAGLGRLSYKFLGQRVDDTRINLRLCFPEKSETERELMVRDVFHNAGLTLFETANAWFRPVDYYRGRFSIEGLEDLLALKASGKSILMLGGHYSMLDLGGLLLSLHCKVTTIYRPQKNAVLNHVMVRQRIRNGNRMIANEDMRRLLRALKTDIVWYASDQDYGYKHAVFAPFFGIPAATMTVPSRMARLNHSAMVMIHYYRVGDSEQYRVRISAPLDNMPGDDDVVDAGRINAELEKLIRVAPTQYMWYHRRFKSPPPGTKAPYPDKPKWQRRAAQAAAREARNKP